MHYLKANNRFLSEDVSGAYTLRCWLTCACVISHLYVSIKGSSWPKMSVNYVYLPQLSVSLFVVPFMFFLTMELSISSPVLNNRRLVIFPLVCNLSLICRVIIACLDRLWYTYSERHFLHFSFTYGSRPVCSLHIYI